MVGIIVQLVISWFIVWLYERNDLRVLGLFPTKTRLKDFLIFFTLTALCCASGFFLKMYFSSIRWELNPDLTYGLIAKGIWWNIKSVLFEELIFRGVLFYILIKKIGVTRALLFSAVAFGIYHWFSFGVIGNIPQMSITFLLTGTMGLLFAYGYAKTMSLYIPIAIHLGWNITQGLVFSDGPVGNGIFKPVSEEGFRTDSYFIFFTVFLVPIVSALVLNTFLLKKKRQVELLENNRQQTPAFNNTGARL
jgi:membrane protease YdiL (CAAX protease family)